MAARKKHQEGLSELLKRLGTLQQQLEDEDPGVRESEEEWRKVVIEWLGLLTKAIVMIMTRELKRGRRAREMNESAIFSSVNTVVDQLVNGGGNGGNGRPISLPESGHEEKEGELVETDGRGR